MESDGTERCCRAASKTRKNVKVRTAEDLGHALGLSRADTAEMNSFRSELTVALAKIIQAGRLTHADIAKGAGTSRTRPETTVKKLSCC